MKPATVLIGAYGAAKVYYDLSSGKVARMRDQYRFAKEYFSDRDSGVANHPFLREKGLQAIIGDERLSAHHIEYLLRLKEPAKAIEYFALGRKYLELHVASTREVLRFTTRYAGEWSRRWRKTLYLSLYGACAFIAFGPLAFSKFLFSNAQSLLTASALTIPVGSYYAWLALQAAIRIKRAELLCDSQELAATDAKTASPDREPEPAV